jgi:hypothetical protein
MATALFIKREDIVRNTVISGNVDTDKFIQFIKIAQEIHIQNYTGTKLYDKISAIGHYRQDTLSGNYLLGVGNGLPYSQCLIHFAMVEYLPFAAYTVSATEVCTSTTSENATNAEKIEVDYLVVEKARDLAKYYTDSVLLTYMSFNQSLFPEYNANNQRRHLPRHEIRPLQAGFYKVRPMYRRRANIN